jgi:hypothetical protein
MVTEGRGLYDARVSDAVGYQDAAFFRALLERHTASLLKCLTEKSSVSNLRCGFAGASLCVESDRRTGYPPPPSVFWNHEVTRERASKR